MCSVKIDTKGKIAFGSCAIFLVFEFGIVFHLKVKSVAIIDAYDNDQQQVARTNEQMDDWVDNYDFESKKKI